MSQYVEHRLGEFFRIKHGYAFKSAFFAKEGDFIVLTPGNFKEHGGLKSQGEKEKFYSADPPTDFILRSGDLLTVMTDLTQEARILGASAFVREDGRLLHNQRLGKIVDLDIHRLDKNYLYHLFNWSHVRDQLKGSATGSTVRHTAPDRIYAVTVPLPPRPTQQRIAAILSAYDDLIEINTRRIAILEEMARRLYEEWFVHFRIPGHEAADFDGDLPSGWEQRPISEVTTCLSRGLAPKYADDGPSLVINQKCIRDQKLDLSPARRQEKKIPDDKLVHFGDVLINSTGVGTLGRVAQVYLDLEQTTVDTHVTIVRPNELMATDYFGLALLWLQLYFEDQGVGSTGQTELSRTRIGETSIAVPPLQLQEAFGHLVAPMRKLCISLAEKNANLRAQRDLLLPSLVSGEMDVRGAEAVLEAAE